MRNESIVNVLVLLLEQIAADGVRAQAEGDLKAAKVHQYRFQAIEQGIAAISGLDYDLTDAQQLQGPGIGSGIRDRVREILNTGTLAELNPDSHKIMIKLHDGSVSKEALRSVFGIDLKTAKKFEEQGISDVNSLKRAVKAGQVKINKAVATALKYHGVFQESIPREEMSAIEQLLTATAREIPDSTIYVCGSYRRGREISNDVDVIFENENVDRFADYIKLLKKRGFLLDHLDEDYKIKYFGFCRLSPDRPVRRIDAMWSNRQELATSLTYFTGPKEFNKYMRGKAKIRGLNLNEHALTDRKTGQRLSTLTEQELFLKVGIPYLTPQQRDSYAR